MGAWGHGSFENDDAMDWIADLEQAKSWAVVEIALAGVLADPDQYREAPECSIALAAVEVVAAALGRGPVADVPGEVMQWISSAPKLHPGLPGIAMEAIDVILQESELQELWAESGDYSEWLAYMASIKKRLIPARES